jgi:hypothetical protein
VHIHSGKRDRFHEDLRVSLPNSASSSCHADLSRAGVSNGALFAHQVLSC